jgi:H/ACA ribonucleoprotein complex subunit 4
MTTFFDIDADYTPDENLGSAPHERSLEQLMQSGFILLDKPPGPSSHQLASWARDLLDLEKLGHGGTLDPFATGVLTLLLGKSVKLTSAILKHDKSYICVLRSQSPIDHDSLNSLVQQFEGKIYNVPPEISAVKVQVRTRTIESVKLIDTKERDFIIEVRCESGTYIRTMARDMGLIAGMPIELKELRRNQSGRFNLEQCVSMDVLADAVWLWKEQGDDRALKSIIHPIESLLEHFPKCVIKDGAVAALSNGAPLLRPGIVSIDESIDKGTQALITTCQGQAVSLVKFKHAANEIAELSEGEVAQPTMVLMDADLYPRRWAKDESDQASTNSS